MVPWRMFWVMIISLISIHLDVGNRPLSVVAFADFLSLILPCWYKSLLDSTEIVHSVYWPVYKTSRFDYQ